MNERTEGSRPRRGTRPQALRGLSRRAGAPAAVAVATLLAVGCGGSSAGADTFRGGTYTQSLAYATCMRSHGVPNFPAPNAQGNFNQAAIQAIERDPQERNAFGQCRSLLPNEGTGLSVTQLQTMQQQNLRHAVKAAHCMRAHGIGNFPDPAGSTQGSGINWQPVISAGLDLNTPAYEAAFTACSGSRVGGPIPPVLAPGAPGPVPGSGGGS